MKLQDDEIKIWENPSHMIMNGAVVMGSIVVTNRRMVFMVKENSRFPGSSDKDTEFWDLGINRVQEINLHNMKGIDYPMIRVHYKENNVFFTFPDFEPRPTLTALIVFINHARLIDRIMSVMKSMDRSLKSGSLMVGEKIPDLMMGLPVKADEDCFQCGKPLIEDDLDRLSNDVKECLSCIP